jgi:hypothetical protein
MKKHIDTLVAGYERDIVQINQKLNAIEIAKVELQTNLQRLQGAVAGMRELEAAARQAEIDESKQETPSRLELVEKEEVETDSQDKAVLDL